MIRFTAARLDPPFQVSGWTLIAAAACLLVLASPARAQHPLFLIDSETTVRGVSFRFPETQAFERDRLRQEIAMRAPSTWDRLRRVLPLVSAPRYPFDPLELQRDVVRLRRFYQNNGFLHPRIDYPASQLDTTSNTIHVIFSIWEGPPLIIQDFGFIAPDGRYALEAFVDGSERERWIAFRDRIALQVGSRYTEFERTRVQDAVLTWLQDAGYAFAEVDYSIDVDSVANTVDLFFLVDPGPVAYVSSIEVEGNETVSRRVVTRELPLKEGDRFSRSRMIEGQRRLFGLSLFRVAISDIPPQPRDSTVVVRYRVREARHRHVSAQTGYGRSDGLQAQADWRHRNFLGGARRLTVSAGVRSGVLARPPMGVSQVRTFTTSVSLRQPYLWMENLSGTITPYYLWLNAPGQALEYQEIGLTSSLLYEIYAFRTVRLQHNLSRAIPLGDTQIHALDPTDVDDETEVNRYEIYDRSILSLSATLGRANDYVEPRRGFLVRPLLEAGGLFLPSDVHYLKGSAELAGYLPVGLRYNLSGRIQGGLVEPFGASRDQRDPQIEYRFNRVRFLGGGPSDVRGWAPGRLGPEIPRARLKQLEDGSYDTRQPDGAIALEQPRGAPRIVFEPVGGLAKVAGNVEFRMPFPGLGSNWESAVFTDFGRIFPRKRDMLSPDVPGAAISFEPSRFRVGVGTGIRYLSAVGILRIDIAMKVNPSDTDLYDPEEVFRWRYNEDLRRLNPNEPDHPRPEARFMRRFQIHLSLGQAF